MLGNRFGTAAALSSLQAFCRARLCPCWPSPVCRQLPYLALAATAPSLSFGTCPSQLGSPKIATCAAAPTPFDPRLAGEQALPSPPALPCSELRGSDGASPGGPCCLLASANVELHQQSQVVRAVLRVWKLHVRRLQNVLLRGQLQHCGGLRCGTERQCRRVRRRALPADLGSHAATLIS
jgi:hypothetical protein